MCSGLGAPLNGASTFVKSLRRISSLMSVAMDGDLKRESKVVGLPWWDANWNLRPMKMVWVCISEGMCGLMHCAHVLVCVLLIVMTMQCNQNVNTSSVTKFSKCQYCWCCRPQQLFDLHKNNVCAEYKNVAQLMVVVMVVIEMVMMEMVVMVVIQKMVHDSNVSSHLPVQSSFFLGWWISSKRFSPLSVLVHSPRCRSPDTTTQWPLHACNSLVTIITNHCHHGP